MFQISLHGSVRNGVPGHRFSGGNTVLLSILDQHKTALGAIGDDFAGAIAANRAMLRSAARLQILTPSYHPGELDFVIRVDNRSGHKLPSGYLSRRVFLHVTVKDGAGQVLYESGKTESDGRVVGADSNPRAG